MAQLLLRIVSAGRQLNRDPLDGVCMEISEDASAKLFLAREASMATLRNRRLQALFVLFGAAFAVWGILGFARGASEPSRPDIFYAAVLIALAGPAFALLEHLLYRFLPAQRWMVEPDRIRMRGRTIGSVRFRKLRAFSSTPVANLPGYTRISVFPSNGLQFHEIVAAPSSQVAEVESELARRLTRRCS